MSDLRVMYLLLLAWSVVQTVIIYQKHLKIMRLLGRIQELQEELADE